MAKQKVAPPPPDLIIGPPKPLDDPGLQIPEFLRRPKVPQLPMSEDMVTEPVLTPRKDIIPHLSPPNAEGMNVIELYLTEGGRKRYLVVSSGTQNMQLLHLPDLEHVEVAVRDVNEQVSNGVAHWFDLPPNLGQRLIDKAVQWEMYKFRYSRSLVNEALTKLGYPPLDEPKLEKAMATAVADGTVTPRKKGGGGARPGGPGVIDTIIYILQNGGGTVDEMAMRLAEAFPDRPAEGMKATIRTQLNRLPKQGRLVIIKEGSTYRGQMSGSASIPLSPQAKAAEMTGAAPEIVKDIDLDAKAGHLGAMKSDFVEQVFKQKAREKEYIETPLVSEKAKAQAAIQKANKRIAKGKAKNKKKV